MKTSTQGRTKTFTWVDPVEDTATHANLSGLEIIEGVRDGRFQGATLNWLVGSSVTQVEPGRATVEGAPDETCYNPLNTVHGSYYAILLDYSMGAAILSLLEPGKSFGTVDMSFKLIRALSCNSGPVVATATVKHLGRSIAVAEAELKDSDGRLCATASSTCMLLDRR